MYDLPNNAHSLKAGESVFTGAGDTDEAKVKEANQRKEAERSTGSISHSFEEESQEAKARWFQSLTLEERMEMLCMFTDMILGVNPQMMERKDAEPVAGRILVLTQS